MTRERKIEILNEILNGNPDAIHALDEGAIYVNLNNKKYTKNGIEISKEQYEEEAVKNPYITPIKVTLNITGVPLSYSEKGALKT